jgi:hypothetical protein
MSIYLVETYVVKADRRQEFTPRLNEFLQYKEDHPEVFPGLRSWKLYQQDMGAPLACTSRCGSTTAWRCWKRATASLGTMTA